MDVLNDIAPCKHCHKTPTFVTYEKLNQNKTFLIKCTACNIKTRWHKAYGDLLAEWNICHGSDSHAIGICKCLKCKRRPSLMVTSVHNVPAYYVACTCGLIVKSLHHSRITAINVWNKKYGGSYVG